MVYDKIYGRGISYKNWQKQIMKSKYCTLFLVRHGETDWNVKGLLQGQTDIPLNKTGLKQAKYLVKKFKNITFDMAFSSDLLRAKRTAEIIALEKKIALKTTSILRERKFGKYEGTKWKQEGFRKLFDKFFSLNAKERFNKRPYQGYENNEELMARLIPFIREISVAYTGKNILIVSHGGIIRAFLNHLGFNNGKELPPGSIENTAYIIIQSDGSDFFIKETSGIKTDYTSIT